MKIYVASSWRNGRQPEIVKGLREQGHDVYDFKNPPNGSGFGWSQTGATAEELKDPRAFRDRVLQHPIAQAGFKSDMGALAGADCTVLVLPCGRSAHLELGWAAGAGQRTIVLLDDPMSEPELMYLMNTSLVASLEELLEATAPGLAELPKTPMARIALLERALLRAADYYDAATAVIEDAGIDEDEDAEEAREDAEHWRKIARGEA